MSRLGCVNAIRQHRLYGPQIDAVERQWGAGSSQRALETMTACHRLVSEYVREMDRADILRLCRVADGVGQQALARQGRTVQVWAELVCKYVQFYALLGRPDIAQQAVRRIGKQWRQPPLAMHGAQQLALLRFAGDKATGLELLLKTAATGESATELVERIEQRLGARSVGAVISNVMQQARRTRRVAKALEYGPYAAGVGLAAKWVWIGNSVGLAGMGLGSRALATGAALAVAVMCVRWALRRSVMAVLTAPALGMDRDPQPQPSSLPIDSQADSKARRILHRAFPAAPSDEAMLDIDHLLKASAGTLSWRLRLALAWSRAARRFAVVEPVLPTTHAMQQSLAHMWLAGLAQMFVALPSSSSKHRQAAASEALLEFLGFVQSSFTLAPLALSRAQISALAAFAAHEASGAAFADYLRAASTGLFAMPLHPSHLTPDDDAPKLRAQATVLAYTVCAQQLASAPTANTTVLVDTIASHVDMPVSAALYRAAFAAAAVARAPLALPAARRLAGSFEARFVAGDPFALHIVRRQAVAACVAPYFAILARWEESCVSEAVARWVCLAMLTPPAAIQCLSAAAQALLSQSPNAATLAESWAILACTYASDHTCPVECYQPLDSLLTLSLRLCCRDALKAQRILAACHKLASAHPEFKSLASQGLHISTSKRCALSNDINAFAKSL
ncbi:hypothetical protein GGI20_001761 [Coemansia sp. BCRC 34301]|nr:hypothetical protein GGI20_001761 [Coemansia sp. BCRC 34301]